MVARGGNRVVLLETEEAEMTLVEHLEELRRRLFVCLAAVSAGTAIAFFLREAILRALLRPLPIEANALVGPDGRPLIAVTGIGEGFSVLLKLSIAAGIALPSPVWVHQLWSFTRPALNGREKSTLCPRRSLALDFLSQASPSVS